MILMLCTEAMNEEENRRNEKKKKKTLDGLPIFWRAMCIDGCE